jgi:hypothetical protein
MLRLPISIRCCTISSTGSMRDGKLLLTEFGDKSKSAILPVRWSPEREVPRAQTIAQTLDGVCRLRAAPTGSLLAVNESFQRLVPLVSQDRRERPKLGMLPRKHCSCRRSPRVAKGPQPSNNRAGNSSSAKRGKP